MNTTMINNAMTPTLDKEKLACVCESCECRPTAAGRCAGAWLCLLFFFVWVVGAVLAKGFWSTVAAVCFPPWGWYLMVEKLILMLLGAAWLQ